MGTKENYEARKAAEKAKRDAREDGRWWFNQRAPIDRFTGWLVAWTALLFIATVINAGILYRTDTTLHDTLIETKKSADAAQKSADAAKTSVDLSDATAERQLRAYIDVEDISLNWPFGGGIAEANITVRNAGQTPARNVVIRGMVATGAGAAPNRLPAYFGDVAGKFGFAADSSRTTKNLGQAREEIYVIRAGAPFKKGDPFPVRVFALGAVYYTDIFGKQRHTRFCMYYLSLVDRGYCDEHNDAN